jgi:hypothetical protein
MEQHHRISFLFDIITYNILYSKIGFGESHYLVAVEKSYCRRCICCIETNQIIINEKNAAGRNNSLGSGS